MGANTVRGTSIRQGDLTMEQAAALELQMGDVLIVTLQDGKARENRIAMMSMVINHVAAVSRLPEFLGEELVLRCIRPILVNFSMPEMQPLHLLKKDDVGI